MGRTDRRWRMIGLLFALVAFGGAAAGKLGQLQVVAAPELQSRVQARLAAVADATPVRGDIVDRNGVVLAHTSWVDKLTASPELVPVTSRQAVTETLAGILDLDPKGRATVAAALAGPSKYVVLARRLDAAQSDLVRTAMDAGDLPGVALEPQQTRTYPNPGGAPDTTLASQLLGFVTADGHGRYGIEQRYDDLLSGRSGQLASVALPGGAGLPAVDTVDAEAEGQTIELTIDARLQLQLEKQLYHAWVLDKAQRVSGLVLDPHTGEVLAWASVPGYDANDFASIWEKLPDRFADPIASSVYEPGSVMKMFTAAAGFMSGSVTPRSRVLDQQALWLDGRVIHNATGDSMGPMRFEDAIAYSRNVATAKVALDLEKTHRKSALQLYRTWQTFGLGKPTGIDISGEAKGLVADPRKHPWADVDLATRAFGQGVAVTQVQLAAAIGAMANGGFKVRPHFLLADTPSDAQPERIIDARIADQLHQLMYHVTASVWYYAEGSLIRGYEVGGKTGTAEIWDAHQNRYLPRTFNFSMVGYVGGDDPAAIVAVRIHHTKPKVLGQGDLQLPLKSFELFRRVAQDVIGTLGVPPSRAPGAGFPEPRSNAERVLFPDRYQASLRRPDTRGPQTARGSGPDARTTRADRAATADRTATADRGTEAATGTGRRASAAGSGSQGHGQAVEAAAADAGG